MALTRKFLKALGIEDEKIDEIITAHAESLEGIKAERDDLKEQAEQLTAANAKVTELQGELNKLKESGNDAAKVQADFDAYKAKVEAEKTNISKINAIKALLKEAGVQRESFIDLLLSQFSLDDLKLEDGKIADAENVLAPVKEKFADCFAESGSRGAPNLNPLGGNGGTMTKEAFNKLSLTEQMKFANEHPAEYKQLS